MIERMLVWDTETTGVDVFNDRIVQLFIGIANENGDLIEKHEWIINPGIPVPEGAAKVHGFTTEYLQEYGMDPHRALWEADLVFKDAVRQGTPIAAFNLNFDLSILTAEMARHSLGSRYGNWIADNVLVLDGLVIDRAKDKYRAGKRKLVNMAAHYGVPFDESAAHKADYDVEITAKVTKAILDKYGVPTTAQQAAWYEEWRSHLEEYFRKTDPTAVVERGWPLREGR